MRCAQDQNGTYALRLFTNLWFCVQYLVSWLCSQSHNACSFIRHNFLCGTRRFKIRELLMLLTCESRFTCTCFLRDGDFCRGSWTLLLRVLASPCAEVTALGHKLKLVKSCKTPLGVESQTHCAMVCWLAATATERSLTDSCKQISLMPLQGSNIFQPSVAKLSISL